MFFGPLGRPGRPASMPFIISPSSGPPSWLPTPPIPPFPIMPSSPLRPPILRLFFIALDIFEVHLEELVDLLHRRARSLGDADLALCVDPRGLVAQIGRAPCRERGGQYC